MFVHAQWTLDRHLGPDPGREHDRPLSAPGGHAGQQLTEGPRAAGAGDLPAVAAVMVTARAARRAASVMYVIEGIHNVRGSVKSCGFSLDL